MATAIDTGPQRMQEYQRLFTQALIGRERTAKGIRLRLRAADGVEAWVRDLAAREKACCPFFDFAVRVEDGEVRWDATVIDAAIASIPDEQYTPVRYPGAVLDPDTGQLISDAQVAEVEYTAFADSRYRVTARLVVRRVLDANTQNPLFPVWRYHPFFTTSSAPVTDADITHRGHAICETVWSDLIDGPWAHQPSGIFAANAAWCILAAICHNLLRAAGTLTGADRYAVARGATLREHPIKVPARLARPQRRPFLHLGLYRARTLRCR